MSEPRHHYLVSAFHDLHVKVIEAQGEQQASKALKEASDTISASPAALQLRWSIG